MKRLWRQIIGGERGQALPIVLSVMIIGGLMIAPALNHISTSLNAGMIVEKNVKGVYAAEAGVEDVLWQLINDPPASYPYPYQLPENVNQMEVSTQTEDKGTYAFYYGDLIVVGEPPQIHYDWLDAEGEMVWVEEEEAYKYTITVSWSATPGDPRVFLTEIGVRLPIVCEYVEDSADEFDENLSTDEPDITQDWDSAYMVNWEVPAHLYVGLDQPTATQTFYVTGEEGMEGDYTWVAAQAQSVGQIGEVIGTFYSITSTATHPESGATTVVADVVVDETDGEVYIVRWQINPE